jgi:DNA primase
MESRIETLFTELNRDALQFQTLYYNERKHMDHLDAQRRARMPELMTGSEADPLSA